MDHDGRRVAGSRKIAAVCVVAAPRRRPAPVVWVSGLAARPRRRSAVGRGLPPPALLRSDGAARPAMAGPPP